MRRILVGCVLLAAFSGRGDDKKAADPGLEKLDTLAARMESYLKVAHSYKVEVSTSWTLKGEDQREGKGKLTLIVDGPKRLRLEVNDADAGSSFQCVGNGKELTRVFSGKNLVIYSRAPGGLADLADDAMTAETLQGTGLEVVTRPDLHGIVMANVSDVKYVGVEKVGAEKAHRIRASWNRSPTIDFWIRVGKEPVLLQSTRTVPLNPKAKDSPVLTVTNRLSWQIGDDFPEKTFAVSLPKEAVKVRDIQTYLLEGGTRELLSKAAPNVELKRMDGKAWKPEDHKGKSPVVLFFWASWVAPSSTDMPELLKLVKSYEAKGVAFYAVNVGEKEAVVRSAVAKAKYTSAVVLDPEQAAARAYRVTSLPVTVLIGKDGTLQAVHVGHTEDGRGLMKSELERLLKGESLVEATKKE